MISKSKPIHSYLYWADRKSVYNITYSLLPPQIQMFRRDEIHKDIDILHLFFCCIEHKLLDKMKQIDKKKKRKEKIK